MKVQAYAATEKGVIRKVSFSLPPMDDYEALVENEGCVFCNTTDKMVIENLFATPDYPVLFGHESFGRVIRVGSKVKKYKVGDRVICSNALVNGYNGTFYSTWGGFATHGVVGDLQAYLDDGGVLDTQNAYRGRYAANQIIPGDFSKEKAALVFPLAETAGAIMQVGDLTGKRVVVIGTGVVGYFFCLFAKQFGAEEVVCIGRRQERVDVALSCGADVGFADTAAAEAYLSGRADIVFECSGNWQIFENGMPYLKDGGLLAVYAVPHQPYAMHLRGFPENFSVKRISPDVAGALDAVCTLLREDAIDTGLFLTHIWDFDSVPAAYEAVVRGDVIKGLVVIKSE
ncbi:MAG: hypothetical protein E7408_03430 [Ruminococcaceae bacterium]|nr:hypothetical protein [Oscillospiraceae bacterium]